MLLSPEIALSNEFKTVLQDQVFQRHLVLVATDEIHVASEWGQHWRGSYSQLALLRDLIDRSVPWLGCSATLDPVMLAEIRGLCGFDPTARVQRASIDRPDIKLAIRCMQQTMDTFDDLDFLVEPVKAAVERTAEENCHKMAGEALRNGDLAAARAFISAHARQEKKRAGSSSRGCCKTISKTIVYVDSIRLVEAAVHALVKKLIRAGCSKESAFDAIEAYHSELAEFDKRSISTEFAKLDVADPLESSKHRIIVATDAMGMGIDNPDIRLVIQWKQPPSMCALWQRAGRAARSSAILGEFLWFVEPWCFGDRLDSSAVVKNKKTDCERRTMLPRGIWELINHPTCIRRSILEFYVDDLSSQPRLERDPSFCCSRCAGIETKLPTSSKTRYSVRAIQSQKHITTSVKSALIEWRKVKSATLLRSTVFEDNEGQMILPDKAVTEISRCGATVDSIEALATAADRNWADLPRYGSEVVEVVKNACLEATLAKTRKRRPLETIDVNSERIRDGSDPKRMRLTGRPQS